MSSAWTLEAGPGGGGGGRPLAFQQSPPFSIFCLAWFKSVTSWLPRSSCPSRKLHWPAGGVYDKRKSAALGFLAAEWALFEMHPSMKLWNLAHRNARQASQDIQREHLPGPRIRKSEGPRVQAGRKRVERDSDGFSGTDKKWRVFCISFLLEERNAAHATPLLLQMLCEVKQTTCQLTSAGCAQAAYTQRPGATCAALGLSQSRFCCED